MGPAPVAAAPPPPAPFRRDTGDLSGVLLGAGDEQMLISKLEERRECKGRRDFLRAEEIFEELQRVAGLGMCGISVDDRLGTFRFFLTREHRRLLGGGT